MAAPLSDLAGHRAVAGQVVRLKVPASLALLEQASIWRSWGDEGQLVTQLIEDMTPPHQARTLAWLRENAELLLNRRRDAVTDLQKAGLLDLVSWSQELAALDASSAAVWLEEQPLVRRLVQLVGRPAARPARGLLRRWRR